MKVTDYIAQSIKQMGITVVFGYIGGSIADLIDSICMTDGLKFIQPYHEQAAAYAANAYAQSSGKLGVAVSSSGPGALNLLNGIANAFYDSIPCLFITGNVHSLSTKCDDFLRQKGFQEMNIVEIVSSITKYAVKIHKEEDIPYCLRKAICIALSGRKGPVLIDIPYDVQRREIKTSLDEVFLVANGRQDCSQHVLRFKELLSRSKRTLMLLGGGALEAREIIRKFIHNTQIPVVTSLRGIDIVEDEDYFGFIGSYGNRVANLAVYYCDLLIVVGSRLDERQTGFPRDDFAPRAKIVRIDIDYGELFNQFKADLYVYANVKDFFEKIDEIHVSNPIVHWRNLLHLWKNRFVSSVKNLPLANAFLSYLFANYTGDKICISDVGQNQMSAAQSIIIHKEDRFLCSAGLGGMGYSLPAAIGAYYACPNHRIITISGDGGFQMNIQELQTFRREGIPIKVVILNNESLGLIRNLQDKLFEKRYFASVCGYSTPSFKNIANAYGYDYVCVKEDNDFGRALSALQNEHACLIEVLIPQGQDTFPEPGQKIIAQNPPLLCGEVEQIENEVKELVQKESDIDVDAE